MRAPCGAPGRAPFQASRAQACGRAGSAGGDSGLVGAFGDSLINCDSGGDAVQLVAFSTIHLFDELTRIRGHRFHEAALTLGKDDVESEGGHDGREASV